MGSRPGHAFYPWGTWGWLPLELHQGPGNIDTNFCSWWDCPYHWDTFLGGVKHLDSSIWALAGFCGLGHPDTPSEAGFLSLSTVDFGGWIILCGKAHPVHFRRYSSTPTFYPLDASCISCPYSPKCLRT